MTWLVAAVLCGAFVSAVHLRPTGLHVNGLLENTSALHRHAGMVGTAVPDTPAGEARGTSYGHMEFASGVGIS